MPRATDTIGAAAQYYQIAEPRSAIRNFVLAEMTKGALYAALFLIGVGVMLWVVWALGQLLPADSKNAPPPMPYSAVQTPVSTASV